MSTQIRKNSETLNKELNTLIAKYVEQNPGSEKAYDRARQSLPNGSTRSVLASHPFPLSVKSAQGSCLTSVDDKVYVDYVSDFTAGLFGHSNPILQQAISQAATNGFSLGAVTGLEAELAESLKARFSSIDLVRFCNSGTEANTYALGAALAHTGRKKVLVFDRGYHGGTLNFDSEPNPLNIPHEYVIGAYDDIERTRTVLDFEIGAILVEPMQCSGGMRPASEEFLRFLREVANTLGAVLIFDEVVTSRLDYHGVQGKFSIRPDMTTLGKYIGGGMPFGAFGGRKEIMGQFDPQSGTSKQLSHSGTFNNNIFSMSAAVAASKIVTKEAIDNINMLGEKARLGINAILQGEGKDDKVLAVGCGSCVGLHFAGPDADVLRELCYFHNILQGLWIGRRGFLAFNFAHTEVDVDKLLASFTSYVDLYV
ncbi:uncharacterized protein N7511_007845 [Penicillium nucicola]|uniref:uncharacterized protein n=1 Tax=Penicillium nucicola TaxID=1850975 RepID=UPI0025451CEB|nr:uncharacterized protein N7511_007845 [Penicillium nucicola]KAJ5753692.1 hypothetical protein N7511_007845 [Penicillium nucicola]